MSDHEQSRESIEREADRAREKLSATMDALEAKTDHVKESAARDLKLTGAVAAAAFAVKELVDSLSRRRRARRQRADLVRRVVLPAPLLVATAGAGVWYWVRRRR